MGDLAEQSALRVNGGNILVPRERRGFGTNFFQRRSVLPSRKRGGFDAVDERVESERFWVAVKFRLDEPRELVADRLASA